MTHDKKLFKKLDSNTGVKWVKIGNGKQIKVKGKGTISLASHAGIKTFCDVLYVPEITKNLLSIAQLLEKDFKVIFEDECCIIKDQKGLEMF